MAAVSFPIIFLRFIARGLVAKEKGWDDWAVGLGSVSLLGRGDARDTATYHQNRS